MALKTVICDCVDTSSIVPVTGCFLLVSITVVISGSLTAVMRVLKSIISCSNILRPLDLERRELGENSKDRLKC